MRKNILMSKLLFIRHERENSIADLFIINRIRLCCCRFGRWKYLGDTQFEGLQMNIFLQNLQHRIRWRCFNVVWHESFISLYAFLLAFLLNKGRYLSHWKVQSPLTLSSNVKTLNPITRKMRQANRSDTRQFRAFIYPGKEYRPF